MSVRQRLLANPITAALAALVLAILLAGLRHPGLFSLRVFADLCDDSAVLGLAALGSTLVLLAGGLDLSVGAASALASILFAELIAKHGCHPLLALAAILVGGGVFGALQGALAYWLELPPFIVTLAGMFLARGAALSIEVESLALPTGALGAASTWRFGCASFQIGVSALGWIAVTLAASWWLAFTRAGRRVYAVGGNANASRLLGLPVASTKIGVYAMSGALAAAAGGAYVLYGSSGSATGGVGLELDAIAAAVVGGTSLNGGAGGAVGTLIGVALFGWIQNVILFEGTLGAGWARVAAGALLFAFVCVQRAVRGLSRST